jgi:CubicO group peptidase (beta-lactamase class C family)
MKKQAAISFVILFSIVLTLFAPSTVSAAQLGNLPANKKFDASKFATYIHSKLGSTTVGYTMVLYKDGEYVTSNSSGYSVLKKDVPEILGTGLPLRPETRMHVASVTKPITATAVLKALQEDPVVSLDSKVADFLPPSWTRGPGVANLTFRDFLSQYTGMNDNKGATSIAALREWIKVGSTRPKSEYIYINANLAIFRVVLPYLKLRGKTDLVSALNYFAQTDEATFNRIVSNNFVQIVQQTVFSPMGITNVAMKNDGKYATRFYNTNNNAAGYKDTDWTEIGGGGGFYLSAYELAVFMSNLCYNDNILWPSTRKLMDDYFLGWQDPNEWTDYQGQYGDYLGHGGGLGYGSGENRVGMNSIVVNFPSGVQCVLLINSLGDYPDKRRLVKDAFDQAVVPAFGISLS